MGALKMIRKPKVDDIGKIERELEDLSVEGARLCAEIDRLTEAESTIEDADELLRAIVATKAAKNRLAGVDRQIVEVRERLATARDAARAQLRLDLLDAFKAAAPDYLATARAARDAFDRLVAAREAVAAAGFASDYHALPIPPAVGETMVLAPELLDRFEAGLTPRREAVTSRSTIASIVKSEPPAKSTAVAATPPAPVAPRAPLREAARPGEDLVEILRSGIDDPERGQLRLGDVISVPPKRAEALIRHSAATELPPPDQKTKGEQ